MKKSQLVRRVDVAKMAEDLGFSENQIKNGITTTATFEYGGRWMARMRTLKGAAKLYTQAKSHSQRLSIAKEALDLCNTRAELDTWYASLEPVSIREHPLVRGKYAKLLHEFVSREIKEAESFSKLHSVWITLNKDFLAEYDLHAYQMMQHRIQTTANTLEVFQALMSDDGHEIFEEDHPSYKIALLAAFKASATSALETLKWIEDDVDWKLPIQILIRKASEIYAK